MLNENEILKKLNSMSANDVAFLVRQALLESGIEYCAGHGEIIWSGLIDDTKHTKENF